MVLAFVTFAYIKFDWLFPASECTLDCRVSDHHTISRLKLAEVEGMLFVVHRSMIVPPANSISVVTRDFISLRSKFV